MQCAVPTLLFTCFGEEKDENRFSKRKHQYVCANCAEHFVTNAIHTETLCKATWTIQQLCSAGFRENDTASENEIDTEEKLKLFVKNIKEYKFKTSDFYDS